MSLLAFVRYRTWSRLVSKRPMEEGRCDVQASTSVAAVRKAASVHPAQL